jgi:excisionase family DNA binding protein
MMTEPTKMTEPIKWLNTKEASERLGITLRSLYRFIDEGNLIAYKFGRVIRLQEADVARFIEGSRIAPGSLDHLYPELKGSSRSRVDASNPAASGDPSSDQRE